MPHRLYVMRLVASRALARAVTRSNATPPALRLCKSADARAQPPTREVDLPVRVLQVPLVPQIVRADAPVSYIQKEMHKLHTETTRSSDYLLKTVLLGTM